MGWGGSMVSCSELSPPPPPYAHAAHAEQWQQQRPGLQGLGLCSVRMNTNKSINNACLCVFPTTLQKHLSASRRENCMCDISSFRIFPVSAGKKTTTSSFPASGWMYACRRCSQTTATGHNGPSLLYNYDQQHLCFQDSTMDVRKVKV